MIGISLDSGKKFFKLEGEIIKHFDDLKKLYRNMRESRTCINIKIVELYQKYKFEKKLKIILIMMDEIEVKKNEYIRVCSFMTYKSIMTLSNEDQMFNDIICDVVERFDKLTNMINGFRNKIDIPDTPDFT